MKKYFLELKNRFILICLTWFSVVAICYIYKETLLFIVIQPNRLLESINTSYSFYFIFTNITEIFSVYIQLIIFLSVQVTFIYIVYHCFSFLSLALFQLEYHFLAALLKISGTIWFFSVIVSNYALIPLTWEFFFSFQKLASDQFMSLHFEAKLNEYLNFYTSLYYGCIFYCQIFTIIIFFLTNINSNFVVIKKFRKLFYYFFVIFSTLVSPPDVFSQIFISFILMLSYEILVFSFITKRFLIRQPVEAY